MTRSQSASSVSTIGRLKLDAGVVVGEVEVPEGLDGLGDERLAVGGDGDVAGHEDGVAALLLDEAHRLLAVLPARGEVGDEHAGGALARERQRGGAPDAARRPRHQPRLALDQTRHLPSFSLVQAAIARASSTSRPICSTSASTESKRCSPRRRLQELEPQRRAVEVAVEVDAGRPR